MTMTSEVQKPLSESPRLRGDFPEEEEEEEIDVVDGTDSIVGSAETPGTKHFIKSFYFRKKVTCKICSFGKKIPSINLISFV